MNTTEPLGLPQGTVRAVLALIFTGATAALFVMQAIVPAELLILNSIVVTFYFTARQSAPAQLEPLAEPFVER